MLLQLEVHVASVPLIIAESILQPILWPCPEAVVLLTE
jgi:hypothetical protein